MLHQRNNRGIVGTRARIIEIYCSARRSTSRPGNACGFVFVLVFVFVFVFVIVIAFVLVFAIVIVFVVVCVCVCAS